MLCYWLCWPVARRRWPGDSRGGRYGRQLAEQAKVHADALNQLTLAAALQQQAEQDKRIIAITDTGDRALIALQACQAYIRALGR